MKALIDLDILPYAYGGMSFEDGQLMPDSMIRKKVDEKIQRIIEQSGADDWVGYLTHSSSNFRLDLATILPYKGNRSGSTKPPKYQMLRDYLLDQYPDNVSLVEGMEADDQLAIDQYKNRDFLRRNYYSYIEDDPIEEEFLGSEDEFVEASSDTIICTIDKDLKMVPGWHYNWNTDEKIFVTEIEGLRWFYTQCLTGDMTDNIKGLHGVGAKSTLISKLQDMDTEEQMFKHVHAEYVKRFGSYADQFLLENGRLLWMLKDKEEMWEFPLITTNEENENHDDIPF